MSAQFRQFGQTGQLDECASKVNGLWLALGLVRLKGCMYVTKIVPCMKFLNYKILYNYYYKYL